MSRPDHFESSTGVPRAGVVPLKTCASVDGSIPSSVSLRASIGIGEFFLCSAWNSRPPIAAMCVSLVSRQVHQSGAEVGAIR